MDIIRFLFSGICHQIPERTLHYGGQPLPLCARCTGTFLGVLAGLMMLWATGLGRRGGLPPWRTAWPLAGLAGWWAVDGLNSFLALTSGRGPFYEPSNVLRVVTGLGLGITLAAVLAPVCRSVLWREHDEGSPLDSRWALPGLLATAVAVGATLLGWRSAPYALWAALVTVAVALTLILANGALVALLARRDGLARRWTEVLPALAAGVLMAVGEAGGLALLRRWLAV